MRYLETDEVILIHERVLDQSGGARGVREYGLLDSAVARPRATFGGREAYHDLFAKTAALGHSLALNHPFVDGNKRTAWEAMHTFIEENGYSLLATTDEIVELVFGIEDKTMGLEEIAAWLKAHAKKAGDRL